KGNAMLLLIGVALVACQTLGEETPSPDPVSSSSGAGGRDGTGGNDGTGGSSSTTEPSGAGGGSTGSGSLGYASGSRLRAKYIDGDDGSRVFTTFHDTAIGTDCTFTEASDGPRCLPVVRVPDFGAGAGISGNNTYFRDSNCTDVAPNIPFSCETHSYISEIYDCKVIAAHQVTGYVPGYKLIGGNCVPSGSVVATVEIPLPQWVGGQEMME
ncbi:MAG: hypothetical protein KC731_11510, partial [Myxococcales bacterium]|nr:hypothetical protein [Myxococcales bacterium]